MLRSTEEKLNKVVNYFERILENCTEDFTEVREVEDSEFLGDYVIAQGISIPVKNDYLENIDTKGYEALFNSKKYNVIEVYCENNSVNYTIEKELYFHVLLGIDMSKATFKDARKTKKTLKKLKKQLLNAYN